MPNPLKRLDRLWRRHLRNPLRARWRGWRYRAMPIAMGAFFTLFPAGLVLYWLTNNLLSIAQQWAITRKIENEG